MDAPYTDEVKRKDKEGHYPYWFKYRNAVAPEKKEDPKKIEITTKQKNLRKPVRRVLFFVTGGIIIIAVVLFLQNLFTTTHEHFIDDFHTVQQDSLTNNGWFVNAKDTLWWNRCDKENSHLTLYTLRGDNWADSVILLQLKICYYEKFHPIVLQQKFSLIILFPTKIGNRQEFFFWKTQHLQAKA